MLTCNKCHWANFNSLGNYEGFCPIDNKLHGDNLCQHPEFVSQMDTIILKRLTLYPELKIAINKFFNNDILTQKRSEWKAWKKQEEEELEKLTKIGIEIELCRYLVELEILMSLYSVFYTMKKMEKFMVSAVAKLEIFSKMLTL